MEALHGIKNKHLEMIEECDKMLMRKLFNCPEGTPLEAFFLETSALPVRFILMGRRLMYYWTILNKPNDELVREVFDAQNIFRTQDSWIVQVENDLKACNIDLSEEEIKNLSKYKMKKMVNTQIRIKALEYLLQMKDSHEKTEHLYPADKMQDYLQSMDLTKNEKILLFKLRIWMIPIKQTFHQITEMVFTVSCVTIKNLRRPNTIQILRKRYQSSLMMICSKILLLK